MLIPYRLYKPEPDFKLFRGEEEQIISCMYTRHGDGYVREKQLHRLFEIHDDWMVPFVIQLLGEYLMSIHQLLLSQLSHLVSAAYLEAYAENPDFVEATKSRVLSYWDCYYRYNTPLQKYPAFQVTESLGWWKASEIPNLRRRMRSL